MTYPQCLLKIIGRSSFKVLRGLVTLYFTRLALTVLMRFLILLAHHRCRFSVLGLGGGVMFRRKLKASRCFREIAVTNSQSPRAILVAFHVKEIVMKKENLMNPKVGLVGAVIAFIFGSVVGLGLYIIIYGVVWWHLTKRGVLFIKSYLYLKTLWQTEDKDLALYRANSIGIMTSTHYIEEALHYAQQTFYGAQLPVIEQAKSEGFYECEIPDRFKSRHI